MSAFHDIRFLIPTVLAIVLCIAVPLYFLRRRLRRLQIKFFTEMRTAFEGAVHEYDRNFKKNQIRNPFYLAVWKKRHAYLKQYIDKKINKLGLDEEYEVTIEKYRQYMEY